MKIVLEVEDCWEDWVLYMLEGIEQKAGLAIEPFKRLKLHYKIISTEFMQTINFIAQI